MLELFRVGLLVFVCVFARVCRITVIHELFVDGNDYGLPLYY